MPDILQQLLLQLILILLNAFFAATEIALISLNEKKVEAQAEDGNKKAKKLLKIIEDPTKFLSAIQVGITLAGFLGSAFAADNFAERLSGVLARWLSIPEQHLGTLNTVSVVLVTLILSYFTLVLGELVPKRIAMKHKEKLAAAVCGVMSFTTALLRPVIWFLTVSTNGMLRLFGIDPHAKEETVSEEDVVIMLDAGADEGTLKQDDVEYIKNVFKLDRLTAADVMTARNAVVAVPRDISEKELIAIIDEEGYSRIPVYEESKDKIVGILHTRKYLLKHRDPDFRLEDVMFDPDFIPETMRLDPLLKDMQKNHTHMVIVVNEYGITSGVLTMEDIIEELLGEIWDEQDEAVEMIVPIGEDTYRVLTGISIEEFFTFFSLTPSEEIASATVNGWLTEVCGNIPEEGFTMSYENLSFAVTKADELMTHEVFVTVNPEPTEESEETEEAEA